MKTWKKQMAVMVAVMMFAMSFAGCAAPKTEAPAEEPGNSEAAEVPAEKPEESTGDGYTIGMNFGYPDSEFFQMVELGLKKAFDAKGWDYIVTYGNNEKITENTTTLLAQEVDAIVDFGCNAEIGSAMVKMAEEKSVPVICIDVMYDGAYFFGADNVQAGEKLGDEMAEWIQKNWDGQLDSIFVTYGSSDSEAVMNRTQKPVEKLKEAFGLTDEDVFWYDCAITQQEGIRQAVGDYLSAHSDQKHIAHISNTEANAVTAMAAADTSPRGADMCHGTHSESGWTFEHFTTTEESADTYVGCVAYDPANYGGYVADMLQTLFDGGELESETLMKHEVITRKNYETYLEAYNAAKEELSK